MNKAKCFAAMVCCALPVIAGCAGHSAGLPSTRAAQTAPAHILVRIPKASPSGAGRHLQWISAATKAIAVNGQGFNVTPASPGCTADSTGVQCTLTADVQVGTGVPVTVTAYDQTLSATGSLQGNRLSTGTTFATITEGASNTVKVTMDGTPAQVFVAISNPSPPMGTAATIPMTLDVRDADGYAIVGTYSNALQVWADAPMLGFRVNGSAGTVQKSSDTVQIVYSGSGFKSTIIHVNLQFASSGSNLANANFTPAPAYGSAFSVGTSLVNASAYRDASYERRTWFTEPAKHSIATYPAGGAIVEFALPSGGTPGRLYASPMVIEFPESNNMIASMYPDVNMPALNEWQIPSAGVGAYQIGGRDTNMNTFFTEYDAGKIGRISVSDPLAGGSGTTLTEFPTGIANSTPAGMAWDDGSSWWFADPGANAIGNVTSNGTFTWYPAGAGAQPTDIAGPDQNTHWWFTEPGISKFASLDSSGTIVEHACSGVPKAIVVTYNDVFVLTTAGTLDDYDVTAGTTTTVTPPSSSSGPVVGIGDGGFGDLMLLRSDGTTGAIQEYYYD